jgi:hypothetical protein
MNDQPCCSLEARHRAVRGCVAEPGFGILEAYQMGWRKFPLAWTRYLAECRLYTNPRDFHVALCTEDPWPHGLLDKLQEHYAITSLDARWLGELLRKAERILETRLADARPHLMAFLGQRTDLSCARPTDEVATAWALQFARDQFFKAELFRQHLTEPHLWDDCCNPIATCVLIEP